MAQTGEKKPVAGPNEPEGQDSLGAAQNGMAELRSQIEAKNTQDWRPWPWEPLNPNDNYVGADIP